jgi:hypothetical protein
MEQASLVARVAERQVRGITEGIYQASGASYWLAPTLVGATGRRRAEDEMSLGYLLSLSEQLQSDLVRLAGAPGDRPSLGMSGEVRLPPERRHEFLNSLRAAIEGAAVEPRVGGRYDFGWDHGPVKILELEPGRTLAYSWRHSESCGPWYQPRPDHR